MLYSMDDKYSGPKPKALVASSYCQLQCWEYDIKHIHSITEDPSTDVGPVPMVQCLSATECSMYRQPQQVELQAGFSGQGEGVEKAEKDRERTELGRERAGGGQDWWHSSHHFLKPCVGA